jgi:hypothetical protein
MTPSSSQRAERHDTFGGNCHDTSEADTVIAVTVKSGKGTARQTIRMDEDLWEKLDEAAKALGTDRSSYLRDFARWAVHEKGARMPRRPSGKARAEGEEGA